MIFGTLNPEKISHENFTHLSISPVRCNYFTMKDLKKVIFNSIIHAYFRLLTLSQKKTNCNPFANLPENVTTLTCEMLNFCIWLKVCCVLSDVGGSEKSQLWVVVSGSEKNRLWCVASGMSGKQCHSECSDWSRSVLIHASSLFRHRSVAQYTTLCWNSAHVATSRCASRNMSVSIHSPLL